MKKCVNCEKMILDGTIKCPYCGTVQEKKIETGETAQVEKTDILEENARAEKIDVPEENIQAEKADVPEENVRVEQTDMPKETVKSETATEKSKLTESGVNEQKQRTALNFCPSCGAKLEEGSNYCARCGRKVRTESGMPKEHLGASEKKTGEILGGMKQEIVQNSMSTRRVFCIIAGIFYLCGVLGYISGYRYCENQILNLFTIVVCALNVFVLYKIGFQCSEQNDADLMYGLLAGCGVEVLLFVIRESQNYYGIAGAEYVEFLRPFIVSGISYYLLKKEGYLTDFSLSGKLQDLKANASRTYSGAAVAETEKEAFQTSK